METTTPTTPDKSAPEEMQEEIIQRAAIAKLGREELEAKWSDEGCCNSCGWHAALFEHDVEDWEIIEAVRGDGILELSCVSKDDEDSSSHRGVKVHLSVTRGLFSRCHTPAQETGQQDAERALTMEPHELSRKTRMAKSSEKNYVVEIDYDALYAPIDGITLGAKLEGKITEQEAIELVNNVLLGMKEIMKARFPSAPSSPREGVEGLLEAKEWLRAQYSGWAPKNIQKVFHDLIYDRLSASQTSAPDAGES